MAQKKSGGFCKATWRAKTGVLTLVPPFDLNVVISTLPHFQLTTATKDLE